MPPPLADHGPPCSRTAVHAGGRPRGPLEGAVLSRAPPCMLKDGRPCGGRPLGAAARSGPPRRAPAPCSMPAAAVAQGALWIMSLEGAAPAPCMKTVCYHCGRPMPAGARPDALYCAWTCKLAARLVRRARGRQAARAERRHACLHCGAGFTCAVVCGARPRGRCSGYCSVICRRAAHANHVRRSLESTRAAARCH